MKCPKCGYQSFNFLSTCKKCGRDLTEMQQRFRLGNPILPQSCQPDAATPDAPPSSDPAEAARAGQEADAGAPTAPEEAAEALHQPFDGSDTSVPPPNGEPDEQDEVAWTEPAAENEPAVDVPDDMEWLEDPFAETQGEPGMPDDEALPPFDEPGFEQEGPLAEEPAPAAPIEPLQDFSGDKAPPLSETKRDPDLLVDEESELDAWLLNGEEPAWRHKEPQAAQTADDPALRLPPDRDLTELPYADQLAIGMPKPSLATRLLAGLVDLGLLLGGCALFVLAGERLRGGRLAWLGPAQLADHAGPYFLVFFGLAFGYFTLFHYLTGQTPGKMVGKLVVTDQSGQPLQLSQAFLRSVGGLICLLPAGLGFCSILLNREGRGWNDRLAGSRLTAAVKGPFRSEADE